MTSAKAHFKGDGTGELIGEFSSALLAKIREYYPDQQATSDPTWGHPADVFVEHILAEARWAASELHWRRLDITKAEIRAELADILRTLNGARDRLRSLSPNFERLLDPDADNLGCADKIEELIGCFERVGPRIDQLRTQPRAAETQHAIAVEMAVRILRVLIDYGIRPAATGDAYFGYTSDAVQLLMAVGEDIGLKRDALTWRDIITKAKALAPDLQ